MSRSRCPARRPHLVVGVLSLVVAGSTAAGVAGPVSSATAGADPLTSCSTSVGVVTAVDFSPWGGNIERGCDGSVAAATTGYQALVAAGFTPAGDEEDGPAFMCRIDGDPTEAQDPCVTTPPASAYWSFWYADAGQNTWTYSQYGATSYHPPEGSVDAWSFGPGARPSFAPSAVAATNTQPVAASSVSTTITTTATAPPGPTTTAPAVPSGPIAAAAGPAGGRSATAATSTPAAGTAPAASTTTTSSVPSAGTRTAAPIKPEPRPRIVAVSPVSSRGRTPTGTPVPALVGAGLIVLVAGGGGVIAWRRRRAP